MADGSRPAWRAPDGAIFVLFFVSGACTLVYEVVWVRMLVLVFGTSVFAVSTVLTAFMAGLALGAWVLGRVADRTAGALRIYAWLELGIGLFALVFPFVLADLDVAHTWLYRRTGGGHGFVLMRFLVCFVVLLVPTTLMGGTLPVLGRFVVRRIERLGGRLGALYAVNTFGAAAGCALAAYVLLERFGTRGATWAAAAANLAVAAVCLVLARHEPRKPAVATEPSPERDASPGPAVDPGLARLVLWGFAVSGFVALGYEVVWARLLSIVLHMTTIQSVSAILIVFLFGLALGGAVGARFVDRWTALPAVFGGVELALGLFGLLSITVLAAVPFALEALSVLPAWWGHMVKLFAVTCAVMLPPTFLMGLLFPLVCRIRVAGLGRVGAETGTVYAANTAGAIAGAFVTGFLLIPFAGTQASVQLLAWTQLAVGAAVLLASPLPRRSVRLAWLFGLAAPASIVAALLPANHLGDVLRRSEPDSTLLFLDEGAGGTVAVHGFHDGLRLLKVNGAGEVPTDRASIRTFRLLGTLPMVLHPDPRDVLVIAYGGGVTLSAVELHGPRRLDCVEMAPGVVEASREFERYNRRVFERVGRPPFRLIVDDGRNHVLRTEQRYDVIVSDATHPGTADSWILYTQEFYRLCRERLRAGGMVAQWLPLHGLSAEDHRMILRTFGSVFPHATLWLTRGYSVMLATPQRLHVDHRRLAARLLREGVPATLFEVDLDDPVSFLAALALDEEAFAAYAGPGRVNTDDRPYVSIGDRERAGTASGLPALAGFVGHLVVDPDPRWDLPATERGSLVRRFRARRHTFVADVALRVGDRATALRELRRAREIDPGERLAARLLRGVDPSWAGPDASEPE